MNDNSVKVTLHRFGLQEHHYTVEIDDQLIVGKTARDKLDSIPCSASVPDDSTVRYFQRAARKAEPLNVTIIECAHCHKLGVSIDDVRITNHKCAGQWNVLWEHPAKLPLPMLARWRKVCDAQSRRWVREARVSRLACATAKRKFLRTVQGYSFEELIRAFRALTPAQFRYDIHRWVTSPNKPCIRTKTALADHWGRQGHYTCANFVKGISLEALQGKLLKNRFHNRKQQAA